MKINRVRCWTENLELTRPYTIAYETIDAVENVFVLVQGEDGSQGIGVASPAEHVTGEDMAHCRQALDDHLEDLLLGKDIRHLRGILRTIANRMSLTPAAGAAADIALHDLWASHLGLPLVDTLGRCHEALPTSVTIGIQSVDASLDEAEEFRGLGFTILKVKIGRSVDEDVERLVKIRECMGPDIKIRVDANQGYTVEDFQRFVQATERVDLEFIEQPLSAGNLAGMRSLPAHIRQITAADESLVTVEDALRCLEPPHPFGIFNIKLMKCGGIAPGLQIAEIARLAGLDVMWGCMDESIVGIAAALHAALASPATRYLDLDGSLDLARDLVDGGFQLKDGMLGLTPAPGLGATLQNGIG